MDNWQEGSEPETELDLNIEISEDLDDLDIELSDIDVGDIEDLEEEDINGGSPSQRPIGVKNTN